MQAGAREEVVREEVAHMEPLAASKSGRSNARTCILRSHSSQGRADMRGCESGTARPPESMCHRCGEAGVGEVTLVHLCT